MIRIFIQKLSAKNETKKLNWEKLNANSYGLTRERGVVAGNSTDPENEAGASIECETLRVSMQPKERQLLDMFLDLFNYPP